MRSGVGTIDGGTEVVPLRRTAWNGLASVGVALVLSLAVSALKAEADPRPPREIPSEAQDVIVPLPAPRECGSTTVARGDGTVVLVPRQGRFVQRCVTVKIVDAAGRQISTDRHCTELVFSGC